MQTLECVKKEKLSKDWIIGFTEGEGSFSWKWVRGKKNPLFCITQKEQYILKEIRQFFGFGIFCRRNNNIPDNEVVWCYYVDRYADLCFIKDFFEGQLKTERKKKQFEDWKKILEEWGRRFDLHWHRWWSPEELEMAKRMLSEAHKPRDVAQKIGRSEKAVEHKRAEWYGVKYRRRRRISDVTGGNTFVSAAGVEA